MGKRVVLNQRLRCLTFTTDDIVRIIDVTKHEGVSAMHLTNGRIMMVKSKKSLKSKYFAFLDNDNVTLTLNEWE